VRAIHLREAHFGEIMKPYREIQPEQSILGYLLLPLSYSL